MGQSPSADIYFGYDLGTPEYDYDTGTSSEPEWLREGTSWEDELARRLGWKEVPFPADYPARLPRNYRLSREELEAEEQEYRARLDEWRALPEYVAYAAGRDEKKALLATVPVELATYGYLADGDNQYAVRVKASVQRADDWGSTPLSPLVEDPKWRDQLAQFITLLGFNVGDKQPAWHLNCSYG